MSNCNHEKWRDVEIDQGYGSTYWCKDCGALSDYTYGVPENWNLPKSPWINFAERRPADGQRVQIYFKSPGGQHRYHIGEYQEYKYKGEQCRSFTMHWVHEKGCAFVMNQIDKLEWLFWREFEPPTAEEIARALEVKQ